MQPFNLADLSQLQFGKDTESLSLNIKHLTPDPQSEDKATIILGEIRNALLYGHPLRLTSFRLQALKTRPRVDACKK